MCELGKEFSYLIHNFWWALDQVLALQTTYNLTKMAQLELPNHIANKNDNAWVYSWLGQHIKDNFQD
jgi:hypothetical protein